MATPIVVSFTISIFPGFGRLSLRPMRIGLLSDTHGYVDESIGTYLKVCDEIWHAGDFGNEAVVERLQQWADVQGVYGNIDSAAVRRRFPENVRLEREGVRLFMRHILPRPARYGPSLAAEIDEYGASLVVCGHSHIALVERDPVTGILHINPGAAGRQGWHTVRTLMRFTLNAGTLKDLELIELGPRVRPRGE